MKMQECLSLNETRPRMPADGAPCRQMFSSHGGEETGLGRWPYRKADFAIAACAANVYGLGCEILIGLGE